MCTTVWCACLTEKHKDRETDKRMCKVNCCTHQIKCLYILLDHQGWLCL